MEGGVGRHTIESHKLLVSVRISGWPIQHSKDSCQGDLSINTKSVSDDNEVYRRRTNQGEFSEGFLWEIRQPIKWF